MSHIEERREQMRRRCPVAASIQAHALPAGNEKEAICKIRKLMSRLSSCKSRAKRYEPIGGTTRQVA